MRLGKLIGLTMFISLVASAASAYKFALASNARIGSTELPAGEYKVAVDSDKAVFTSGKKVVAEAPAKVETGAQKFRDTQVSLNSSVLQSISVGGTNMKIVLVAK